MVQEWQGAYMDYSHLKGHLKALLKLRHPGPPTRRRSALLRAFSGLVGRPSPRPLPKETEDAAEAMIPQSQYQALLAGLAEEGADHELDFFKKLDAELEKVRAFHEAKVRAAEEGAAELSKQMDALIALRVGCEEPGPAQSGSGPDTGPDSGANGRMGVIEEGIINVGEGKLRPRPLQVLEHVRINVDPETPVSTLKSVVMRASPELSFTRDELRRAEKKLRKAFVEFHQQLRLLKSYSFLNMLAFSKIMKKYDKITSRDASKIYLHMIDMSSLGSSDEVYRLIGKLEAAFIKHFANGNRREGMKVLRPGQKRERHRTTFLLGLFTGCCIALIAAIVVSVHARNLLKHDGGMQYMKNIFPLYSLFGYVVLHLIMYGANTYFWTRLRVNYPFIFGCKPGTSLGFREVLLVASGLSVLTLAAVLAHLDLEMDPETEKFQLLTELLPLFLVAAVVGIALCPFNVIYRSSRFFLIRSTWRCICAPLYKVTFIDFFLADQLTSQVQAIRSLQFYICYYVWGDFRRRSNTCSGHSTYKFLYIAVAVIPYWLRLLQCIRRVLEEKNTKQGLNGLKYFSTLVAVVMRSLYDITVQNNNASPFWRIMAAVTSGITTIYNTYWDIVVDWGLLRRKAKNRWLRDKLLISNKAVYVVAIIVNILLRLVWMQLVLDFNLPFLHRNAMVAVVACLEIVRRGIWNFFRLENEHFSNVENYRAFKSIPMPFYYEQD